MLKILILPCVMAWTLGAGVGAYAIPEGVQLYDLDREVEACTNFYEFANGGWRADNPIPAGLQKWSRRVAAHDGNWRRQRSVLEATASKTDWKAGSAEQVAGDYYASCTNEQAADAAGIAPLKSLLAEIEASQTLADIERNIRRLHDLGVPVGFSSSSAPGYHDPLHYVETIAAGGLGLPDRDLYLKSDLPTAERRRKWRAHVTTILTLGGHTAAEARAAASAIESLERRLAGSSLEVSAAADPVATDHVVTFAQLKRLAPRFDWDRYFDEAKLPKVPLNVAEPKLLQELDSIFRDTTIATWKTYLQLQLLDSASPYLSEPFQKSPEFKDNYLGKAIDRKSRAQACVESTDSLFGDALAQLYVRTYFPPAAKARVQEMVGNLRLALRNKVEAMQWMAPTTKKVALAKLTATDVQVGYPDQWKDYSVLHIQRDDLWGNVVAGRRFNVTEDRAQVGKGVSRKFWLSTPTPSSADGYILVELNKMVLPAGQLQPPFFNLNATEAVNYGALGIAVAHDLTHFIDSLGAAHDVQGYPVNWWTEADRHQFDQRGQCLVDQYENYFIAPGVHHDGRRVSSESVADLTGMQVAFAALQLAMKSHPVPIVDGFTPEQQFFISWGQAAGAAMRLDVQRQWVTSDPHPVPEYRVIGPLSNSPDFRHAFSCPPTAAMIRPPEKRCDVW